jgi:translation elongation factor EF-4
MHSRFLKIFFAHTDKVIPRQLFEVPIQAVIGRKVIARETLSAVRADVTAGLYGGAFQRRSNVVSACI